MKHEQEKKKGRPKHPPMTPCGLEEDLDLLPPKIRRELKKSFKTNQRKKRDDEY